MTAQNVRAALDELAGKVDDGSIDSRAVRACIAALLQGRRVARGTFSSISFTTNVTIPVPMDEWLRVAKLPLAVLGLQRKTVVELQNICIYMVGELLLHSGEELVEKKLTGSAHRDVRLCLQAHNLRLPTPAELQAARGTFWVELSNRIAGQRCGTLRVAAELAGYIPLDSLQELSRIQFGFFEHMGFTRLGELLAGSKHELRMHMRYYILFCRFGKQGVADFSAEVDGPCRADAEAAANRIISWVESAGLTFAR